MKYSIFSILGALFLLHQLPVFAQNDSDKKGNTEIIRHTIRVNNLNFSYLEAGKGEVLLLLHGFPQHSHMWRKIMPELARQFRVIAPDMRGMGGSTIAESGYDKKTLAQDMLAFLKQLGIQQAKVVGYDLGGGVAYALALEAPEIVQQLAIMEYVPSGFGYEAGLQPTRDWQSWQLAFFTVPDVALQFIQGQERELLAWYFWHWSYDPEAVNQEDFEAYVRQLQKPGALRAGFSYFATVFDDTNYFKAKATKKLSIPVLALGGEFGAGAYMVPGWQQLAENVSGGIVPKTGHWIADEQPEQLAAQLSTFFKNVGSNSVKK